MRDYRLLCLLAALSSCLPGAAPERDVAGDSPALHIDPGPGPEAVPPRPPVPPGTVLLAEPSRFALPERPYAGGLVASVVGGDGSEAIDYALVDGPPGLTLTADAELAWTPAPTQLGSHPVTVSATHGGQTAEITFVIDVGRPVVEATALIDAAAGGAVEVSDPDSALLGLRADIAPGALSQDAEVSIARIVDTTMPVSPAATPAGPAFVVTTGLDEPARFTLTFPRALATTLGLGEVLFFGRSTTGAASSRRMFRSGILSFAHPLSPGDNAAVMELQFWETLQPIIVDPHVQVSDHFSVYWPKVVGEDPPIALLTELLAELETVRTLFSELDCSAPAHSVVVVDYPATAKTTPAAAFDGVVALSRVELAAGLRVVGSAVLGRPPWRMDQNVVQILAHEVFHLFQHEMVGDLHGFWVESTAEYMAAQRAGVSSLGELTTTQISRAFAPSLSEYEHHPYRLGWFWQYLTSAAAGFAVCPYITANSAALAGELSAFEVSLDAYLQALLPGEPEPLLGSYLDFIAGIGAIRSEAWLPGITTTPTPEVPVQTFGELATVSDLRDFAVHEDGFERFSGAQVTRIDVPYPLNLRVRSYADSPDRIVLRIYHIDPAGAVEQLVAMADAGTSADPGNLDLDAVAPGELVIVAASRELTNFWEDHRLVLDVSPVVDISGEVIDQLERPIADDATVELNCSSCRYPETSQAVSPRDGRFEIDAVPSEEMPFELAVVCEDSTETLDVPPDRLLDAVSNATDLELEQWQLDEPCGPICGDEMWQVCIGIPGGQGVNPGCLTPVEFPELADCPFTGPTAVAAAENFIDCYFDIAVEGNPNWVPSPPPPTNCRYGGNVMGERFEYAAGGAYRWTGNLLVYCDPYPNPGPFSVLWHPMTAYEVGKCEGDIVSRLTGRCTNGHACDPTMP